MSAWKELLGSRRFWSAFGSGIIAVGAQLAPWLALIFKWDPAHQAQFTAACDHISAIVVGLGGLLCILFNSETTSIKKIEAAKTTPPQVPRGND